MKAVLWAWDTDILLDTVSQIQSFNLFRLRICRARWALPCWSIGYAE